MAKTNKGNSVDSGTLEVVGIPPKLITDPATQTVTEGTNVRLLCEVSGDPIPEHTWFQNENRITSLNDDRFKVDEKGTLTIEKVTGKDTNKYICRADNNYVSFEGFFFS